MKKETDGQGMDEQLDSRVIPVMREAVATVQLALFGELKEKLSGKYGDWPPQEYQCLVGCIVNDVFGTPAQDTDSLHFARQHLELVEKELREIAANIPALLPHLTDALRMQTLCDHEEEINSLPTLLRARAVGLLLEERNIPMPSTFMIAVRKLGAEYGLLEPLHSVNSPEE